MVGNSDIACVKFGDHFRIKDCLCLVYILAYVLADFRNDSIALSVASGASSGMK